jgi:hypothetical protein
MTFVLQMQIQVYFPGTGHPASGVVRTFVRDNTDTNTGAASQVRSCLSWMWRRDGRGMLLGQADIGGQIIQERRQNREARILKRGKWS